MARETPNQPVAMTRWAAGGRGLSLVLSVIVALAAGAR
jgi:hypothetical protein